MSHFMSFLSEPVSQPHCDAFFPSVSFSKRGFSVRSFGTGTHVKLPGPAPDKPNVYDFKTTYDQMYNDLLRKDKELYPSGLSF